MTFNSFTFLLFLLVTFFVYWLIPAKRIKIQNFFLLIASYVFYGWWDWRFLSLIIFSSLVDYFCSIFIEKYENESKRKLLLLTSLVINLGLLGFFKYCNFFIDSFKHLVLSLGIETDLHSLNIILPVGISFYTFQSLSYTIDVYRKKQEACKDPITFMAYIAFFPQLVAGPIERSQHLLTQFLVRRNFDYNKAMDGVQRIVWGLFKKTVIADNAAVYVNEIFSNYQALPASSLILGAVYFSLQLYGDFSGYSDIAIGTAKLFGFDLMNNFAYPYFSKSIDEFWRRWHISLSAWFKDYLFIPLGGSRGGKLMTMRNIFIVFLLSGLWHGAKWTFVIWGFINALYYIPVIFLKASALQHSGVMRRIQDALSGFTTFMLFSFSLIFFRAENIGQAFGYLKTIFTKCSLVLNNDHLFFLPFLAIFFVFEWIYRKQEYPMRSCSSRVLKYFYYLFIVILIMNFGFTAEEFIYFQF